MTSTPDLERTLSELVGHPLPEALLALMRAFPPELAGWKRQAELEPYERFLYPDLATMLAANEEVRAEDIWTTEGPWPAGCLDIGADMGGDRFALALDRTPAVVLRLAHDVGEMRPLAGSLEEYVAGLVRMARGEARSMKDAFPTR
jgi:hypothetical protein